ncbi:hypothetical protein JCM8097_000440 [Rhodosporidiobolus ruineniae]
MASSANYRGRAYWASPQPTSGGAGGMQAQDAYGEVPVQSALQAADSAYRSSTGPSPVSSLHTYGDGSPAPQATYPAPTYLQPSAGPYPPQSYPSVYDPPPARPPSTWFPSTEIAFSEPLHARSATSSLPPPPPQSPYGYDLPSSLPVPPTHRITSTFPAYQPPPPLPETAQLWTVPTSQPRAQPQPPRASSRTPPFSHLAGASLPQTRPTSVQSYPSLDQLADRRAGPGSSDGGTSALAHQPPPAPAPTVSVTKVVVPAPSRIRGLSSARGGRSSSGPKRVRAPPPRTWYCTHEGCDKVFARPSALTSHLRTHSGDRPFVCPSCARPFSVIYNLQRHMKTHPGYKASDLESIKAAVTEASKKAIHSPGSSSEPSSEAEAGSSRPTKRKKVAVTVASASTSMWTGEAGGEDEDEESRGRSTSRIKTRSKDKGKQRELEVEDDKSMSVTWDQDGVAAPMVATTIESFSPTRQKTTITVSAPAPSSSSAVLTPPEFPHRPHLSQSLPILTSPSSNFSPRPSTTSVFVLPNARRTSLSTIGELSDHATAAMTALAPSSSLTAQPPPSVVVQLAPSSFSASSSASIAAHSSIAAKLRHGLDGISSLPARTPPPQPIQMRRLQHFVPSPSSSAHAHSHSASILGNININGAGGGLSYSIAPGGAGAALGGGGGGEEGFVYAASSSVNAAAAVAQPNVDVDVDGFALTPEQQQAYDLGVDLGVVAASTGPAAPEAVGMVAPEGAWLAPHQPHQQQAQQQGQQGQQGDYGHEQQRAPPSPAESFRVSFARHLPETHPLQHQHGHGQHQSQYASEHGGPTSSSSVKETALRRLGLGAEGEGERGAMSAAAGGAEFALVDAASSAGGARKTVVQPYEEASAAAGGGGGGRGGAGRSVSEEWDRLARTPPGATELRRRSDGELPRLSG